MKTIEIDKIYDKFFKKMLENPENTRDLLKKVLPQQIKKRLDFSTVAVDPTEFVSNEFKEGYSDIVVKAKMKGRNGAKIPTDIYFILEHKSDGNVKVFIQILKYMCFIWEKDINAKKPLRVIIPIIFYHGKKKWKVPGSFAGQFDVDDEVKRFLLDFRYILFDTNPWDFRDESNNELKNNVFLFTALVLMKASFTNDTETILEIFRFWHERGFTQNKENILFFLAYISQTQAINRTQLKNMLDESRINGGDIMQTLAQQLRREGKIEGKREKAKETARKMLDDGLSSESISKYTGLPLQQIEELMRVSN
jgi:predicted transposase/invertase (TIGR01784 family)